MSKKTCTTVFSILSLAAMSLAGEVTTNEMPRQEQHAGVFRIMFCGNSITRHGKAANLGWTHVSGMAASSEANDFAHLFAAMVSATRPKDTVEICYSSSNAYSNEMFKEKFHKKLSDMKPELVIYQGGEAATANDPKKMVIWQEQYDGLLNAFVIYIKPLPKIIAVSTWDPWIGHGPNGYKSNSGGEKISKVQKACCYKLGVPFVSVGHYAANGKCFGTGESGGVRWHPNDAGMRGYALELFKAYLTLYKINGIDAQATLDKAVVDAAKTPRAAQKSVAGGTVIYKVEKNDTLEKISNKFFGNADKVKTILKINKDIFGNPLIMPPPGTPIVIPQGN